MEENEIDIFVQTEDGKSYTMEVPRRIKYGELKEKIRLLIFKHRHFFLNYKSKKNDNENNENEILELKQGDKIFTVLTIVNESHVNVKFHLNTNLEEADMKTEKISGILLICLLEFIAKRIDNVESIKNVEIREIISDLKKDMDLTNNPEKDIKANLSQKYGNNIIAYKNYINEKINDKEIGNLIGLVDKNKKKEIIVYWSLLSKYEEFNLLFEKDFAEAIEKSYFDYSLIGVSIYQQDRRKKYLESYKECESPRVKYLFHGTQIDPISNIITNGFLYTRKPFYGMGIYFSDMLDYVSFYCGGNNYKTRRKNFGKTLPVGETFSCVGTEVYYSNDNIKNIYDFSYHVKELDHFPTYDEIKKNYRDKMVEKNGLHFVRIEPQKGQVIQSEGKIIEEKGKGKFVGTEYVITEMDQMLPLYGLTLKRNEYFVIWRDPNFKDDNNKHSLYLKNAKMYLYNNENINVYIESCTEKALEIIKRKKFNKIILISSIGLDLSGKTFVETARKILGFDVMVLFFSSNKKHLSWIQNFPNALYTTNTKFYQQYVKYYNKEGLLNLKKEVEKQYNINLTFTKNFLEFPKFVNCEKYSDLIFEELCPNFRKVIIKNRKNKRALVMNKEGTVQFISYEGIEVGTLYWYITLINNEITLFSKDFYLFFDEENKLVKGYQFMKRWKIEKDKSNYILYYENKNNILSIDGEKAVISGNNNNRNNQLFQFVDLI